jgi:hypothetical protein
MVKFSLESASSKDSSCNPSRSFELRAFIAGFGSLDTDWASHWLVTDADEMGRVLVGC